MQPTIERTIQRKPRLDETLGWSDGSRCVCPPLLSGAELPDPRGADGSQPGPLPAQRPLRLHPQARLPAHARVELQPREHRRGSGARPHAADDTREYPVRGVKSSDVTSGRVHLDV